MKLDAADEKELLRLRRAQRMEAREGRYREIKLAIADRQRPRSARTGG